MALLKCQVCGKEELFPFLCSYCKGYFCVDHRLPEKHECSNLPKDPLFWYEKRRKLADSTESRIGLCPKCEQGSNVMIDYDAKTMTFECKICGHKFMQSKKFPHDIVRGSTLDLVIHTDKTATFFKRFLSKLKKLLGKR